VPFADVVSAVSAEGGAPLPLLPLPLPLPLPLLDSSSALPTLAPSVDAADPPLDELTSSDEVDTRTSISYGKPAFYFQLKIFGVLSKWVTEETERSRSSKKL
jgi:hypothetical protein